MDIILAALLAASITIVTTLILTLFELLAQQMGFSPEELHALGAEHLKERYEEFARRGWR